MMIEIPPGWIIIAGALIIAMSRGLVRQAALLGLPLLALYMIWACVFVSREVLIEA